jgi:hypothetical protein
MNLTHIPTRTTEPLDSVVAALQAAISHWCGDRDPSRLRRELYAVLAQLEENASHADQLERSDGR